MRTQQVPGLMGPAAALVPHRTTSISPGVWRQPRCHPRRWGLSGPGMSHTKPPLCLAQVGPRRNTDGYGGVGWTVQDTRGPRADDRPGARYFCLLLSWVEGGRGPP